MLSFRLTPRTHISIDASYDYFLHTSIPPTGASAVKTSVYGLIPSMNLTT
jgi:hypothetical protein